MKRITILLFLVFLVTSACSLGALPPDSIPLKPTSTSGFTVPVTTVFITETPAPDSAPTNPNDHCGNPYYPIVDGAKWIYRTQVQDNAPTTATHSMSVLDDGSFTLTVQGNDDVFTIDGICGEDGVILMDVPGISATYSGEGGGSSLSTTNDDGVTVPDDIQVGNDWSQTISVVASSDGEATLSATVKTTYKALGYETVTVPAGTFYALKVEQNGSMTIHGSPPFETHGFLWYAQGVGTVKSGLEGTYISELVSYSIP